MGTIYINATVTDDLCEQGKGSIELTPTGGIPPYSYLWSFGGSTSPLISGLSAGSYTVTIADAIGCSRSFLFYIYNNAPALNITANTQQPSCGLNPSPGQIEVQTNFGTPPYTYSWNVPGNTTAVLNGISGGDYTVTATDTKGCSTTKTIRVDDLETNNWFTFPQILCQPVNGPGQILLYFDGGTAITWPLSAAWSNGEIHTLDGSPGSFTIDTLLGLSDGNFGLTLTDAAGCKKSIGPISLDCEPTHAFSEKSCLQLRISQPNAQPGETICVPVTTSSFIGLLRLNSSMRWDTSKLGFMGISAAALDYADFKLNSFASGYVRIEWAYPSNPLDEGLDLPDGTALFNLCFKIKSNAAPGTSPIRFGPDYYGPGTFQIETYDPYIIGVIGFEGAVHIGSTAPDQLVLDACATIPTCATDFQCNFQLSIVNGTPPYAVQWKSGDTGPLQTGTLDDLGVFLPGTHHVTVTDQTGKTGATDFALFAGYGSFRCIWPGDADDNNAANHYDLLYLGFGHGATDLPRKEKGIAWQGSLEPFGWSKKTPLRKVNFNNMDCDGNGSVTQADIQAILLNWGQVIRPGVDDPFAAPPVPADVNSTEFQVFIQPDTVSTDSIALLLQVGTAGAPAGDINGLAFSIFYDTAVVQANTLEFAPQPSWFGDPDTELFWIQKNFPDEGRLDIAITRKGISPKSGFGPVGVLKGLLQDDMFRQVLDDTESSSFSDTLITTHFKIDRLVAMSSAERALASAGMETPLVIVQEILSNTDQSDGLKNRVRLFPNPANTAVVIDCPGAEIERIIVLNSAGLAVGNQDFSKQFTVRLNTAQLPAGLYWVNVHTEKGTFGARMTVQH